MTLEELRQAMEDAKAKAAAAPEDEALNKAAEDAEKAYNDAKAVADADGGHQDGEGDRIDESKLDEGTKSYLAKLRKENAKHRTKAKDLASQVKAEQERNRAILKAAGFEVEEGKPEEQVKALAADKQTLAFRNAILESAVQQGVPGDQLEYYEFLISKAASELEEGEELEDDKLAEIVAKVKKAGGGGKANSTVTGGKGGEAPKPGQSGQITLERFCAMSMVEKSKLFESNKELYTDLMMQARAKKKLV